MRPDSRPPSEEAAADLTDEERATAAARAVELVALTLAADR